MKVAQMTYELIQKRMAEKKRLSDASLSKAEKDKLAKAEAEAKKKRIAFLRSPVFMYPLAVVGGLLSYLAGNMGPILNVYLVFLDMEKVHFLIDMELGF